MLGERPYTFCGLLDDHDGLNLDDELLIAKITRMNSHHP